MSDRLDDFLEFAISSSHSIVIKRLSANDTGATGAHQSGPYIPKSIAFSLCPSFTLQTERNADQIYPCEVASHLTKRENRLTWYNQESRDECRITKWATPGKKDSIIQPSLTGGLVILVFALHKSIGIEQGWAWFCESEAEEATVESLFAAIEPGVFLFRHKGITTTIKKSTAAAPCSLSINALPASWLKAFPDAASIVQKTLALTPSTKLDADARLVIRRDCEFQVFKSVELAHVLPKIQSGFSSVESFIDLANSVTNRRKSRSGRSFELHLKQIFDEHNLIYSHGSRTEGKKTPDFLFPSVSTYHDSSFPTNKLRMLGVKTTCKDRWRQIISEADRIPIKHLATLQEGVSVPQFEEMKLAGIRLVVPKKLHTSYPASVRPQLLTLDQFIKETVATGNK